MGQQPAKTRYVVRSFGGGVYRGPYVHRIRVVTGSTGHVTATCAPGVGTITLSGQTVTRFGQAPDSDLHLTQVRLMRLSYGAGVHRKTVYRLIRRVLPLTTAEDKPVGVGTVTIQGLQPGVDIVTGTASRPGVGTLSLQGARPALIRQNLLYTQVQIPFVRRVVSGTGIYRREVYKRERRFLYVDTYPEFGIRVEVGSGSLEIGGHQAFLEPRFTFTGESTLTLQGLPPSITADGGQVSSLTAEALAAIKAAQARRRLAAKYSEAFPKPRTEKLVIALSRPVPQRVIGLQSGSIRLSGAQIGLQRRIRLGSGFLSITGRGFDGAGAGELTLSGSPVTVTGAFNFQVGAGEISVNGSSLVISLDGQVVVSPGVGQVTISGQQAQFFDAVSVTPGAGEITLSGEAAVASVAVSVGAGTLTLSGQGATAVNQLILVGTNPGLLRIVSQAIGLSTPEKATNPTSGNVVLFGSSPRIVATGHWEQTAGDGVSWTQTAGASVSWAKVANGSDGWTKI